MLSKIDQTTATASQLVQSVDVLQAIRWVAEAWDSVKEETVKKCFRKAGITCTDFSVVGRQFENEDPFADLDEQEELQTLVDQISYTEITCCGIQEYVNGEGDMPICMEYDGDWEDRFLAELNTSSASSSLEAPNEEEEEFDLEPPLQKILKYQDAIIALEDVRAFMDSKGHSEEATRIASIIDKVTQLHTATLYHGRQTTLQDFFHPHHP